MQSIHFDNAQCWGNVSAPSCLLLPPTPHLVCAHPCINTVSILGLPENVVWAVLSSKHVSTLHLWLQHLCAHSAVNMCRFVWLCGSFFSCTIKNLSHPHKLHEGSLPVHRCRFQSWAPLPAQPSGSVRQACRCWRRMCSPPPRRPSPWPAAAPPAPLLTDRLAIREEAASSLLWAAESKRFQRGKRKCHTVRPPTGQRSWELNGIASVQVLKWRERESKRKKKKRKEKRTKYKND